MLSTLFLKRKSFFPALSSQFSVGISMFARRSRKKDKQTQTPNTKQHTNLHVNKPEAQQLQRAHHTRVVEKVEG
jgi:hypothetical protein